MNQFRLAADAIVRHYFPALPPTLAFSRAKGVFTWLEKPLEYLAAFLVNEPLCLNHANRIIVPLPKSLDKNSRYTEYDVAMLCHAQSRAAFGIMQATQKYTVGDQSITLFEQAFCKQISRVRKNSDDNLHFAYDAYHAFQEYAGMNSL
ncbi:hypothetical protein HY642_01350, partial [Candidatus Woesearchaeota archaeon]|nr:hypothetical protein [Candidatus Woesearchaeota archaeon]